MKKMKTNADERNILVCLPRITAICPITKSLTYLGDEKEEGKEKPQVSDFHYIN